MKSKNIIVFVLVFTGISQIFAQAPKVASFSPLNGPVGTQITINGSGFNAIADSNVVYFGAARAIVKTANVSQLTVMVPAGATYTPLSVINKVTKLSGVSTLAFTETFPPDVVSFDPKFRLLHDTSAMNVRVGDIDGDGKTDIIATSPTLNLLMVLHNKSTAGEINKKSFATPIIYKTSIQAGITAITDMDGDGKPDIVLMNVGYTIKPNGNNSLSFFHNVSKPGTIKLMAVAITDSSATAPANYNFKLKPGDFVARVGDYDGDGRPDIAVLNSAGFITIYHNTYVAGQPLKTLFGVPDSIAVGPSPTTFTTGDMDGDGKLDIVVTNYANSSITVLHNTSITGSSKVSSFQRTDFPLNYHPSTASLGDVDGDGILDVIIAGPGDKPTTLIHNTSTPGHFKEAIINIENLHLFGNYNDDFLIQDLDGDGKPDLLTLNTERKTVNLYTNKSAPGQINSDYFNKEVTCPLITIPDCIADLDGDGRPDIIIGSAFGIDIYRIKSAQVQAQVVTTTLPLDELVIYPNPAVTATATNVKYTLPVNSDVLISVYNRGGTLLKSFKGEGIQAAGIHVKSIELSDLRMGVYVITITANNYNKAGKLLIQ
jgi:hypothetical protein